MTHLTFDEISDLADRTEPPSRAATHIAECAECRDTLTRVRAVLAAAHALPHDMAPPDDAWSGVRDRARRERRPDRRVWARTALIAASVVLMVAVMSVVTLSARGRSARLKAAQVASSTPTSVTAVRAVDRSYAATIAELRAGLASQRSKLAPGTVRTVDRALTVIDSAIAEARAALASDPANQALVDILSAHYERQVDLLQRATELSSL
jgi:hypothetical protein